MKRILLAALFLLAFPISIFAADVNLGWDANTESDLAGYKIYWGQSSGVYDGNVDVGNRTSATVTGLDEGETYFFAATAYDTSDNESGFSSEISYLVPVAPDTEAPSVPTNLQVATVSEFQAGLSWDASMDDVGVAGYNVYRDGVLIATTTEISYQDSGLVASVTYVYTVSALDSAGNESGQSSMFTYLYIDTAAPDAPTSLVIIAQ